MSISFSRYIAITSGVGGGAAVRLRDLIMRLFTTSEKVPAKTVIEMDTLTDVGAFFGTSSPEYLRAAFYFGWISKNITAPKKISFGRWANALTSAKIFGKTQGAGTLAQLVAAGATASFKLTLGAYTSDVTVNLTGMANMAAVATAIQTAVRAIVAGGAGWTGATVTYDAPTNTFNLVSGTTGVAAIAVAAAGTGTPIAALLGWAAGAVFSPGVVAEEPVQSFIDSVEASDNFGTAVFVDRTLSLSQVTAIATQNDTYNVKFHYAAALVTNTDRAAWYAALAGLSGVSLTYTPNALEYDEVEPAAILAATDYAKRNSVQNYMFQIFALTPKVTTNSEADAFDLTRVNYYGRTQTAGQFIDFYQRGVMMGLPTDPVDMNVYANEIWLKDSIGAGLMSLLLSLGKVSANEQGRTQLLASMQASIDAALFNGTISVGKPFTVQQKLYIQNLTGDANAWQQVQRLGYWIDMVMSPYTTQDGRTEWKAVYTLIYSKDDAIRKVEGSDILI